MKGLVAEIALHGATNAFDRLYSYAIPPEYTLCVGCRVLVPFGKGNIKKQGMVFNIFEGETDKLKSVITVIDREPVLNDEAIKMCEYMRDNVFCTYYDAVNAMLPTGITHKLIDFYSANSDFVSLQLLSLEEKEIFDYLSKNGEKAESDIITKFSVTREMLSSLCEREALIKNSETKQKMNDATQKWVRLNPEAIDGVKLTPRQREVVDILRDIETASVKELRYFTGVTVSVIENLIKKGVLVCFEKQVFRTPNKIKVIPQKNEIILTDEQQSAFDGLLSKFQSEKAEVSLLYGVTGSGKTSVFLRLVDEISAKGRGVIVMVPEIALTPQMIDIFTNRYGNKIAVFHSALSQGQRMDEWKRIKNGDALIAIGTRSAIFAPFSDLGLIIIDEEQEHTYKSEKSPRFHTRDLAKFRTAYHKGLLCLASATPSIESYTLAKAEKYSLFTIKNRYGNAVLPTVETVDMKKEILSGNSSPISQRLYDALNETLENKKQAILLLNRRGHNTYISCPDCGYVATCPNCSISMTYHSANKRLMCHYCGHSISISEKCPECGKEHLKFMGIGTQKAQEELQTLFPNAKILRLDADSTVSRESYSTYLSAFARGEYDILLGTQMVAKGLDFPNVTLVGVLGADSAMYSEDFRSFERMFSLLTQVVGRAGRGDSFGRAIIQTVNPESNIIELAKNQDYDTFYSEEILTRKLLTFPPYCDICVVWAQSISREDAQNTIYGIFSKIKEMLNDEYKDIKLIVLGPSPSAVAKVNNRYRYRMIIKCKNNKNFRNMLKKATDIKLVNDVTVSVDMNPETVI